MTIQTTKPSTINEYAASHGLSETAARRRIRPGGLGARLEHGRYFIYDQNGVHSGDEAPTQNGQVDIQIEQVSDKEDSLRFSDLKKKRNHHNDAQLPESPELFHAAVKLVCLVTSSRMTKQQISGLNSRRLGSAPLPWHRG